MKIRPAISYSLTIGLLGLSLCALADEPATTFAKELIIKAGNDVIVPDVDLEIIKKCAKNFDFDWGNHATISTNKKTVDEVDSHIKKDNDFSKLQKEEKETVGKFLYKVSTYYTHILHQPDIAIANLTVADALLTDPKDKVWNYNQLAYAYEQKFAATGNEADKFKAFEYINKVVYEIDRDKKNKEVAFAYSVQGLVQADAKDYTQAELSHQKALAIYESIPNGKDEHYIRIKNRLAQTLINQGGHDREAIALLEESKKDWQKYGDISADPYAATNLTLLGEAYLKTGKNQAAQTELTQAINIYKNIYGANSVRLAEPYRLLADSYERLGNKQEAQAYSKKASAIIKG